ncbi:MAG: cupin domain-containing protein [Thermoleophilia bacterium]|nr:cupin domain-containing protein [Thermoleophilia bacterium]
MAGEKKAMAIKVSDVESMLPPKHTNTDSWPLIMPKLTGNQHVEFFLTEMRPGAATELDTHPDSEHIYFIISGRGKAYVEDQQFDLEPGVCLFMTEGCEHRLDVIGTETLRFAVVFAPPRKL